MLRTTTVVLSGILFSILTCCDSADAATTTAASCSSSDVQNAINSASNGDTVQTPGSCSVTWSTVVTIPSTKGITLSGQGTTTVAGSPALEVTTNAATSTRVTGFIFTGPGTDNNGDVSFQGNSTNAPYRLDNCTFTNSQAAVFLVMYGNGTGLIDHNSFTAADGAEMIHNMALGAGDATGWKDSITPGSPNMVYIETNTFSLYSGTAGAGNKAIESYYGSRNVFRYNTLHLAVVDQHGTPGNEWARWWEIYNNSFSENVSGANVGTYMVLRGGSGVIFNNAETGTDTATLYGVNLWVECVSAGQMCNGSSGQAYPQPDQIGRGINQNVSPAYMWNNTVQTGSQMAVNSNSVDVALNRDYYVSTTQPSTMIRYESSTDTSSTTYAYAPFTYPYPLTAGGMPNPAGSGGGGGDTTPPTVSITSPTAGSVVSGAAVTISAAASDNVGVVGVQFKLDGGNVGAEDTATPYSTSWNTAQATNGSHTLTAVARDAAGNQTTSAAISVTVTNTDTQAPSTPTGLGAAAVSASQINLSWTASTDNVGVAGYTIFRAAVQVGTASTTTYSDSGLTAATLYTYTVSAYDAAGNSSVQSAAASATTLAASQSSVLPSSRTIDWSTAGIPGGIPSSAWPIYQTLSASGGADDSVAIQGALNAAPAGSVVLLKPGTYTLHRASTVCSGLADDFSSGVYEAGLCINKKVVLRGSGPDQTILQYGDGANFVSLGQTFLTSANTVFKAIVGGATKGSTQVTVQSSAGITAGTYLTITQNNPLDSDGNPLVDVTGYTGSCSNCGHGFSNNVMTQVDKVTAVSGSVLTLATPLYFDYTNSPQFYLEAPMVEYAGLENLRLQPTASSGTGVVFKNINLESCAYCWVHNVESDMAVDRANIYLSDVYASEISNNYLNDAYSHASGEGYGIMIEFRGSANLIQNNIVRKARHSTVLAGGSGNVWGYNYLIDPYMSDGPNVLPEGRTHGAHPYMNLWEGNIGPSIELDYTHGSSSHNTLFRNYYNLTSTNPTTGSSMTNGIEGVNIAYFNNYVNVVGNVIGEYGTGCTASVYEQSADAAQKSAVYNLGYYDDGGSASPNAGLSAKVGQTLVRGGNWDCSTNSVVWSSNVPSGSLVAGYLGQQTLPASLYLAATPNWFGASGAVWPPINPSAGTRMNKTPAQLCYESGPKGGAAFNPTTCYSPVSQQPPVSGVTATLN